MTYFFLKEKVGKKNFSAASRSHLTETARKAGKKNPSAAFCAAALVLLAGCGQRAPTPRVTQSPSYWRWQDEHYPREDTAHYLPCEEQQPHEENEENFEEVTK